MYSLRKIHGKLPEIAKEPSRKYYWKWKEIESETQNLISHIHPEKKSKRQIKRNFKQNFIGKKECAKYKEEFESKDISSAINNAEENFNREVDSFSFGGIEEEAAFRLYATIRKLRPEKVVETGVCNGTSSLAILLALEENEKGELYSIDLPFKAEESLKEFRDKTFDGYGGAAIPSDKEPGWIIPENLRENWELKIGKSQKKLPRLLENLGKIDVFIHDSEHSFACMAFEYEMAWTYLKENGHIISDDINWNNAFEEFAKCRNCEEGRIQKGIGYLKKKD